MQLVEAEIKNAGGLMIGKQTYTLRFIIADAGSTPEMAVNAARKLIEQDTVAAIVGHQYSRDAIPVAKLAEQSHIPMISPLSTHPETTAGKRYVFRAGFVDDVQGRVLARVAREEPGVHYGALLFDVANTYNRGLAEIFRQDFEERGGQVVAFETYTTGEQDFSEQLARIRESQAEDIRQKIFDPFFTTKPSGEGSRLGLDICRRIIEKHHGTIDVESQPGKTSFIVDTVHP